MSAIETEVKNNSNEISLRGYLERTGNGARKGNGLIIDPSVVVEQEGFNTRTVPVWASSTIQCLTLWNT